MIADKAAYYKLAINTTLYGKKPGVVVGSSDNFKTAHKSVVEIVNTSYVKGLAICAGIFDNNAPLDGNKTHKIDRCWLGSQLVIIDIDTGNHSLIELFADDFVGKHCAGIWASSSYQHNDRRWHLLFALDKFVDDKQEWQACFDYVDDNLPFNVDRALRTVSQAVSGTVFTKLGTDGANRSVGDDYSCLSDCFDHIQTEPIIAKYRDELEAKRAAQLALIKQRDAMPKVSSDKARQNEISYVTIAHENNMRAIASSTEGNRNAPLFAKAAASFGLALVSDVISTEQVYCDCLAAGMASGHDNKSVASTVNSANRSATPATLPDFTVGVHHVDTALPGETIKSDFGMPGELPDLATFTPSFNVDLDYISKFELTGGHDYCVRSAIGTGKSTQAKQRIDALPDGASVLYVTMTRALNRSAAKTFNIENAETVSSEYISVCNRMCITVASLHKIPQHKVFDLIILDEFMETLDTLFGGTLSGIGRQITYRTICSLIGNARQVLSYDAYMTDTALDWLRYIRTPHNKIVTAIKNTWKRSKDTTLWQNSNSMLDNLLERLNTGEKGIDFPLSSKGYAEAEFLRNRGWNVFHINGDNSNTPEAKNFVENINEEYLKYDVIVRSPVIGTGVDVTANVKSVYGKFGHNGGDGLTPTGFMQALGRVRNATNINAHVQSFKRAKPASINWQDLLDDALTSARMSASKSGFRGESYSPILREMEKLNSKIKADKNRETNDMFAATCKLLQEAGNLTLRDDLPSETTMSGMRSARLMVKLDLKERVLKSTAIDSEAYQKLCINDTRTLDDDAGYLRWQIEQATGQVLSERLYDDYGNLAKLSMFERYCRIYEPLTKSQERDRDQIEQGIMPSKRSNATIGEILFEGIVTRVFGDDWQKNTERYTEDQINDNLRDYCNANAEMIDVTMGSRRGLNTTVPHLIMIRALRKYGIKIKIWKTRLENGQMEQRYAIDHNHLYQIEADRQVKNASCTIFVGIDVCTTNMVQDKTAQKSADVVTEQPFMAGFEPQTDRNKYHLRM